MYTEKLLRIYGERIKEVFQARKEILQEALKNKSINVIPSSESIVSIAENNFSDMPDDKYLRVTEDEVEAFIYTDEMITFIKDNLPRDLKELNLPSDFFEDLEFLKQFPNLKKIKVTDYARLSLEQIRTISETSPVEEIELSTYSLLDSEAAKQDGVIYIRGARQIASVNGIIVKRYPEEQISKEKVDISISMANIKKDAIKAKELYEKYIGKPLDSVDFTDQEQTIYLDSNKVKFITDTPQEIPEIYSVITQFMPTEKVVIKCENKTYDNFYYLNSLARKLPVEIDYGTNISTDVEGFTAMRETIDWIKEIIPENLSQIEKVAYITDVLKTLEYAEDNKNTDNSRYIPNIIKTGKIVCAGYSEFAVQLFKELGINCVRQGLETKDSKGNIAAHARVIARIDDDKYNIHGIYVFDPTWDSVKTNLSRVSKDGKELITTVTTEGTVEERYDALSLYRYFLVPLDEYETRFPNDTLPSITREYKRDGFSDIKRVVAGEKTYAFPEYNYVAAEAYNKLFPDNPDNNTIESYMHAERPTLDTFRNILLTVRKAEGYTKEESEMDVEKNIELHRLLGEQNGKEEIFFTNNPTR